VKGQKIGSPVHVLEGMVGVGPLNAFGFSDSGTLVYVMNADIPPPSPGSPATLVWIDRKGSEQPLPASPRAYSPAFRISPEGGRVAFSSPDSQPPGADIWIYDLVHNLLTRLTVGGSNRNPVWTPDGKHLIYTFTRGHAAATAGITFGPRRFEWPTHDPPCDRPTSVRAHFGLTRCYGCDGNARQAHCGRGHRRLRPLGGPLAGGFPK
jgi:hypothetical protein